MRLRWANSISTFLSAVVARCGLATSVRSGVPCGRPGVDLIAARNGQAPLDGIGALGGRLGSHTCQRNGVNVAPSTREPVVVSILPAGQE